MNERKNKKLVSLWLTEEELRKLENRLNKVVLYTKDMIEISEIIFQANKRGDFKNG